MKQCRSCGIEKSFSEFHKDKERSDGYSIYCKPCKKLKAAEWYASCSEKVKARVAEWREDNKERKAMSDKRWASNNRGKTRASSKKWREKNPETARRLVAEWFSNNPHKSVEKEARRRAAKLQATPVWANLVAISCKYQVAAMLNREGLQEWHVDHVVPLQGRNVCGLHVESNLQIIPARENFKKSNLFEG